MRPYHSAQSCKEVYVDFLHNVKLDSGRRLAPPSRDSPQAKESWEIVIGCSNHRHDFDPFLNNRLPSQVINTFFMIITTFPGRLESLDQHFPAIEPCRSISRTTPLKQLTLWMEDLSDNRIQLHRHAVPGELPDNPVKGHVFYLVCKFK